MNKLWFGAALILCACAPQKNVMVDLGDVDDYRDFLEDRADEEAPEPFKPEPLYVSAIGKVRAQPDIAVITAAISAENKNESAAMDEMSKIVNAVQDALSGQEIETGFTGINSRREFDETCRNDVQSAVQRHNQITSDYWFNRRLDQRGDTKTKRRPAKARISQKVCAAQSLKVSTQMVIRIQPADAAGDVLRALSDAGAENARLFGYDFTDYDGLYQKAAEKAVTMAREKAEAIARLAGATLADIESFSVSGPSRTGRFGPQPNVIRPARPYQGQSGSVVDRQTNQRSSSYAAPAPTVMNDDIVVTGSRLARDYATDRDSMVAETVIVQEASTELVTIPAQWETIYENGQARRVVKTPASVQERTIPAVTKMQTRRVKNGSGAAATTNALSMSLLSGPQTISVTANLSYNYETPLDGKIIMDGEE